MIARTGNFVKSSPLLTSFRDTHTPQRRPTSHVYSVPFWPTTRIILHDTDIHVSLSRFVLPRLLAKFYMKIFILIAGEREWERRRRHASPRYCVCVRVCLWERVNVVTAQRTAEVAAAAAAPKNKSGNEIEKRNEIWSATKTTHFIVYQCSVVRTRTHATNHRNHCHTKTTEACIASNFHCNSNKPIPIKLQRNNAPKEF